MPESELPYGYLLQLTQQCSKQVSPSLLNMYSKEDWSVVNLFDLVSTDKYHFNLPDEVICPSEVLSTPASAVLYIAQIGFGFTQDDLAKLAQYSAYISAVVTKANIVNGERNRLLNNPIVQTLAILAYVYNVSLDMIKEHEDELIKSIEQADDHTTGFLRGFLSSIKPQIPPDIYNAFESLILSNERIISSTIQKKVQRAYGSISGPLATLAEHAIQHCSGTDRYVLKPTPGSISVMVQRLEKRARDLGISLDSLDYARIEDALDNIDCSLIVTSSNYMAQMSKLIDAVIKIIQPYASSKTSPVVEEEIEKSAHKARSEEQEIAYTEDLLNRLYEQLTGQPLGLRPEDIPNFLLGYLQVLQNAGLKPSEYNQFLEAINEFVGLAKSYEITDINKAVSRAIIIPSSLDIVKAKEIINAYRMYNSGTLSPDRFISTVSSIVGIKQIPTPQPKPRQQQLPTPKPETEIPSDLQPFISSFVVLRSKQEMFRYILQVTPRLQYAYFIVHENSLIVALPRTQFPKKSLLLVVDPDYANTARAYVQYNISPYATKTFGTNIVGFVGVDINITSDHLYPDSVWPIIKYVPHKISAIGSEPLIIYYSGKLPGMGCFYVYKDMVHVYSTKEPKVLKSVTLLTSICPNDNVKPGAAYYLYQNGQIDTFYEGT